MMEWTEQLRVDPLPCLLSSDNEALRYFVRRDLLDEDVAPIDCLWETPAALKIIRKQRNNGSWRKRYRETYLMHTHWRFDAICSG